ncbi:MAG: zf-HC2 domain-containing protein [Planctomycetes bacterium]|nr:zf-HC2 domain-containing protein [Planctomycetota bacterium]
MNALQNCAQAAERLTPYAEGALPPDERAAVEAHLRECLECRAAFERLSEVRSCLAGALGKGLFSRDFNETTGRRLAAVRPEELRDVEDDEALLAPAPGFLDRLQQSMGGAPWWILSGAFHALLVLLVFLIGMVVMQAKSQDLVIVTNLEKQEKPPEPEKKLEREILEKPVPVVQETNVVSDQTPIVTHEVVEFAEQAETENESDAHDTRGEDGLSDVWLGGHGTVGSIGVGGGGRAGAFGRPGGAGGRLKRAIKGGGGQATESAVDKALEWLARHQEDDGHWDTKKHEATLSADCAATGLALLAFLGAGHTEKVGKYKTTVRKAVAWLVSKQEKDGAIGRQHDGAEGYGHPGFAYHHAACGLALAEAAAMAKVPATVEAAQKAVTYSTEVHQNDGDGPSEKKAWRYIHNSDSGTGAFADISVTGWYVMQLKSAKVAGLQVNPASFEGAMRFIESVESGKAFDGYEGGRFGYTGKTDIGGNTTAIGILSSLFLGKKAEDMQGGGEYLLKNPPKWDAGLGKGGMNPNASYPIYYTYYGTLSMFQMGGHYWKEWNEALKAMLLPTQRKDGDFDGSWDPLGGDDDKLAGRVYMTAMSALCLEVYYRYLPLYR